MAKQWTKSVYEWDILTPVNVLVYSTQLNKVSQLFESSQLSFFVKSLGYSRKLLRITGLNHSLNHKTYWFPAFFLFHNSRPAYILPGRSATTRCDAVLLGSDLTCLFRFSRWAWKGGREGERGSEQTDGACWWNPVNSSRNRDGLWQWVSSFKLLLYLLKQATQTTHNLRLSVREPTETWYAALGEGS